MERFFPRASRTNPADTLISEFRPLKQQENDFLLLYATKFIVICYRGPKETNTTGKADPLRGSFVHRKSRFPSRLW